MAGTLYLLTAFVCLVGVAGAYSRRLPMLAAFMLSIAVLLFRVAVRNLAMSGHDVDGLAWLLEEPIAAVNAALLFVTVVLTGIEFLERSKTP